MIQFFETRMGKTFIEKTMPAIANALVRIADSLEKEKQEPEEEDITQFEEEPGYINRQGDGPSGFDEWQDNKWCP